MKNFLLTLADKSESIREIAYGYFFKMLEETWFKDKDIDHIVKALGERVESVPFKEPTEELRVMIIKSFTLIAKSKYKSVLQHNLNLFSKSLSNILADKNPECKKQSAQCITK